MVNAKDETDSPGLRYFFQQAGLSTESSFSFALGQYGINMIGVFGAWALMSRGIGRR